MEKNKTNKKVVFLELGAEEEKKLEDYIGEIETLLNQEEIPAGILKPQCKKCAYYEYCFI